MKKVFTLLTLALMSIGSAWATDYEWSDDGQKTTLSVTAAKGSSAAGHYSSYSISYGGTTYTKAVKMESATTITFTTSATSTITIGITSKNNTAYTDASKATVKFDGTETASALDAAQAKADGTYSWKGVTIENVAAGSHTISRGGSEVGVFYIMVQETGAVLTKLSTPEITYNATTGAVTIGSVANASKVTYTTDGSTPTASSDTYSATFNVADGTIVKAIAIGDGVSYSNSDVALETVLLTGITISEPVIKKFNGAVAITCANSNATIKYSIDGGATYNTYERPFTLIASATVQAYAERTGCITSSEASLGVDVVANTFTKTIYLDWRDFDNNDQNSATGKTGTVAEGYTLAITGNAGKNWSSNGVMITTPDGEKQEWKVSNGAQNTLTIPAGVHVTKLTIYSTINSDDHSVISGWKEVGGVDYQTGDDDYKNVPMGSYSNVADYKTNPDVRVYNIDQTGGTITFNNGGTQLFFVIALDILEDNATATIGSTGWATFCTGAPLDFTSVTGLKAYIVTGYEGTAITTTQMTGTVPANTPLLLEGATTDIPVVASSSTDVSANKLVAGPGSNVISKPDKTRYVLSAEAGVAVFKKINATDAFVPKDKAYLEFAEVIAAPMLSMGGETTGINAVNGEGFTVNGSVYDLQGRRVAQPTKGLYIVNGRKVVIK